MATYYVLIFVDHGTRRICLAGSTQQPHSRWMQQTARNLSMEDACFLNGKRYFIHDRDGKFSPEFDAILASAGLRAIKLPPKSPTLNAFAERVIRSIKEECLSKVIPFGEPALWQALDQYVDHFHTERNHQGLDNRIPFPACDVKGCDNEGAIRCRRRFGGLLKFYYRTAA